MHRFIRSVPVSASTSSKPPTHALQRPAKPSNLNLLQTKRNPISKLSSSSRILSNSILSIPSLKSYQVNSISSRAYHGSRQIEEKSIPSSDNPVVETPKERKKRTLLIDASPLIFRAFHSVPALGNGIPLNAVYGFLRTLLKLMRENEFDHLAVCLDGDKSMRKEIDPTYKANRKETPPELIRQFPIVEEALRSFGIFCPRLTGYEADDLIATYTKLAVESDNEVVIVSPDKDMLQLVGDAVFVITAASDVKQDVASVVKKFGVIPSQVPHLQALIGDSVDNIPKVSGLTESAAKNLIRTFGSVEAVIENIDQIATMQHRDAIRLHKESIRNSYQMAKLKQDAPVSPFEMLKFETIDKNGALAFCSKYKLKSISSSLEKEYFAEKKNTVIAKKTLTETAKKTVSRAKKSSNETDMTAKASTTSTIQQPVPSVITSFPTTGQSRLLKAKLASEKNQLKEENIVSDASPLSHDTQSYENDASDWVEGSPLNKQAVASYSTQSNINSNPTATTKPSTRTSRKQPASNDTTIEKSQSDNSATEAKESTSDNQTAVKESQPVASSSSSSSSSSDVAAQQQQQLEQQPVVPIPPIPRAKRKRSNSSDTALSTEGHVSEEVDIDTDPKFVELAKKYKESKKSSKAAKSAAASDAQAKEESEQNDNNKSTENEAQANPAPENQTPSIKINDKAALKKKPEFEEAVKPFLEALKQNSVDTSSSSVAETPVVDPTPKPAAASSKASKSSTSSRLNPPDFSSMPLDNYSDEVATFGAAPAKRTRKPKISLELNDVSSIGLMKGDQVPLPDIKPTTTISKRKNVANGPGSRPSPAPSKSTKGSSLADVAEDDEESNLELVDFIKNRTVEVDVEFVNLFKHCSTPAERRRVIETKIKGVNVANDEESARRILSKLMTMTDRYHACDTETVDLDLKKQGPVGHGRIICASIYVGPDVDFGNGPRIWIDSLEDSNVLEIFREYFESPKILKVWHNYGFDRHVFYNHGINVVGFGGDTMHMARLWDSSRRGAKAYSLEVLSRDLLNATDDGEIVAKTSMKQRFGRVKLRKDGTPSKAAVVLPPLDEIQRDAEWLPQWIDYATLDAEDTWRIRDILHAKLEAMNWVEKDTMWDFYRTMWLPFGELLTDMERRGIKVDKQYLAELVPRALEEKSEGERKFVDWAVKYVGPECRFMNPGSDAQKQQLLFAPCKNLLDPSKLMPASREFEAENTEGFIEEGKKVAKKKRTFIITGLGLPFTDATDSGWPAVSHPVLAKLVGDPPEKYGPLLKMFEDKGLAGGKEACEALAAAVESSKVDTLINTFMIPLGEFADSQSRIHGSLNINTETGRLSSRRPNLQNQPAHEKDRFKIRKAFTCEPGNNLIVADYGQLELRLLAHMTNCKSMIEAFRSGGDFHSRTALGMYSHVKKAIDDGTVLLEWDSAKGKAPLPLLKDAFGTERRRAKTLNFSIAYGKTVTGLAKDWNVSMAEARETLDKWYADRPEVLEWQQKTIARAHVTGWTRTLLGRYRPLPDINSRDRTKRGHSERAAINTPLQGGAADITTRAMILLHRHPRLKQLGWHQLLQIHDELILEGPKESTDEAMHIVVETMSNPLPYPLLVDLVVDAKSATTWYEAK